MRSLVFICLIFTGCAGYQYAAPLHFVPVNYEKGHGVGNLTSSSCQPGYALTDHVSVFAMATLREHQSHNSLFYSKDEEGFYKTDKHNEMDLGVTFFRNYEDFGSFEILSGIGCGTTQYRNFNISSTLDLSPSMHLKDYDAFFYRRIVGSICFLEPGVQLRVGPEYVKLLIQGSGSVILGSSYIYYKEYRFTIGISCSRDLITD